MRVVFCWSHISGYMAACWRALAQRSGVEVSILAYRGVLADTAFDDNVVSGLNVRFLDESERANATALAKIVVEAKPDILVISGWSSPAYRALAYDPTLASARVMTMDTPWRGTLRQRLGGFRMAGYLSRIDKVVVPGERAFQLARALGVPERNITRGMYGVEYAPLAPLYEQRRNLDGGWPRRFLFTARYVQEKGVDLLLDAYRSYRRGVSDPWPLTCCGKGPLQAQVAAAAADGVTDRGFVQPADLPAVYRDHGVFVLTSRYEPWGVVLAEAAAAGLPIICTEACGAAVETVRTMFNGLVVATSSYDIARALRWAHDHHAELPEMGARSRTLGAAFADEVWADRWAWMFDELLG
jgi:glycosyltransferase involved in cell wall biosynthesis